MSERILTVRVVEAALRETGDASDRVGDNIVNVLLACPRPGKAEVVGSSGLVALTDHSRPGDAPDRPALFAMPVLKEKIEGDVALLVHVLERDRTGRWAGFLRRLAAGAIEGLSGQVFSGLARHVFSEAAQQGAIRLGDREDERIDVVAVAEAPLVLDRARLDELAASGQPLRVEVPLVAPRDLARPREKGRLAPLRGNGHLVVEVHVTE